MKHSTLPYWILFLVLGSCHSPANPVQVSGRFRQEHTTTLLIEGPKASEAGAINPFRDFQLIAVFTLGEEKHSISGFFAADGRAAETGAIEGNKWMIRFRPGRAGIWTYELSFLYGQGIALSEDPSDGTPVQGHGTRGKIEILPAAGAPAGRSAGPDLPADAPVDSIPFPDEKSPEYLLADPDIDGNRAENDQGLTAPPATFNAFYEEYRDGWQPEDPTWRGNRGKALIGMLNALAQKDTDRLHVITFPTENSQVISPRDTSGKSERFDVSKLDQWEIILSHMESLGIGPTLVLEGPEEGPASLQQALGAEKQLYYREMIARFAHHPSLHWQLGLAPPEAVEQARTFSAYFKRHDPYRRPVSVPSPKGKSRNDQ